LPFATILADEVLAARSSPQVLTALLQRADPFLYRLAQSHHRYHAWDDVDDIYQEYRESFVRCIDKYDVSRSFEGRGFISFLNWQIRTDYRSHYRRLEAEYSVRGVDEELDDTSFGLTDMEPLLNKALLCLSPEDRDIFYRYVSGENIAMRVIDRIHRDIRHFMLEEIG
jgi:RNA polymerase sigma factor (sigma-70 family)